MAEFVELRAEKMIPELEQLERHKLFEEPEIRCIVKTRKSFEYKIKRRNKKREDYVKYIQYEMNLLKLVKSRRHKHGLHHKETEVDMMIANRINRLFKEAIFRFSDDIRLWISYIKFCKQVKVFRVCVSYMLVGMLAVHSYKPGLWKLAATWEFEENNSVENARQFLLRGLKHHPGSKLLHMEAFRMELLYAEMICKQDAEAKESDAAQDIKFTPSHSPLLALSHAPAEAVQGHSLQSHDSQGLPWHKTEITSAIPQGDARNEDTDPVKDCHLAELIYQNASKKIRDLSFFINLLNIAKDFTFTNKLQERIITDLLTRFPNDELTWDAVARCALIGFHFESTSCKNGVLKPVSKVEICDQKDTKYGIGINKADIERLRVCCIIYQLGLKHAKCPRRMWECYLDTLLEINKDTSGIKELRKFRRKLLRCAFQRAHDHGYLQEKYYVNWAAMHLGQKEELSTVLRVATERYSSSVELWQMRLRALLSAGEEKFAMDVFQDAIACLKSDDACTLPLWKMLIQYCQTKSASKVDEVFREGIVQGPAVSSVLKPMYLEWLVLAKNINVARQVYQTISIQPPFCHQLHKKMAELESVQPDTEQPRIQCYELACEQFGKHKSEVWMDYIKFERKMNDPKKVKEIYRRALKTLDESLIHGFISEFCEYWVVKNM